MTITIGRLKLFLVAAAILPVSGCGYYSENLTPPSVGQAPFDVRAKLGFEIVKTILARNKCLECHSAERGNRGGLNLESYASVKPAAASVASTTASGFMPLGGPRVNVGDVAVLQAWADAGAPEISALPLPGAENLGPQTPVDEPTPRSGFATVKAAIFTPHCIGCHSGFGEYARVAARLPDIQRAVDTNIMPMGGPPLSAELKTLLNDWIAQGAPE